jgi:hypothetical protein
MYQINTLKQSEKKIKEQRKTRKETQKQIKIK